MTARDWLDAVLVSAGSALLIWILATGLTWPGSGLVIASGITAVGGGVIGLMGRREPVRSDEEKKDVEVPQ